MVRMIQSQKKSAASGEQGYLLIGLLFLLAMMLFFLTMAAPKVFTDLQRDREEEMMHRGKQYTRAIQLYYRKFGRYPSTIAQLENTNNLRFLRRKYVDPMTGKADWKLIGLGQAKTGTMGFFGQMNPLQTPGAAFGNSIGQAGGNGTFGGGQNSSNSGFGNWNSSFGNSTSGFGNSGSSFGSSSAGNSAFGGFSSNGSAGTNSGNGTAADGSQISGQNSNGQPQPGDPSNPGGQSGSQAAGQTVDSSGNSSGFGNSGSSFGGSGFGSGSGSGFGSNSANGTNGSLGAPFVGVESQMAKVGVKEFKKKKNYNEWEFLYDPTQDQKGTVGLTGAGSNPTGFGTSGGFGTQNGFGNPVNSPGPGIGGAGGQQPGNGQPQDPTQNPSPPQSSNPQ